MEKDVVAIGMTKLWAELPLTAPLVTVTNSLHVQVQYAHQVSILLATYK